VKESSVTKNNKKLAGWIDDFVNSFATTKKAVSEEDDDNTKTAEININDLPKVTWNDETYYVSIDNEGASVINGFGNVATTIPNVKTIEEVNDALNAKQIVVSNVDNSPLEIDAEMEKEIEKALAYTEETIVTAEDTTQTDDQSDEQKAENYVNNDPNSSSAESTPSTDATTNTTDNTTDSTTTQAFVEPIKETVIAEAREGWMEGTALLRAVDYTEKTAELIDEKFAEFEENINNKLNEMFTNAIEQFYARMNPGDIYDQGTEIQEQEIAKFNQEAEETVNQINQENAIDRTTPEGKYTVQKVVVIDESPVETEVPTEVEETPEVEDLKETDEVELPEEEEEIFKQGSCPCCSSKLAKNGVNKNYLNIVCSNKECNVEYKVNLDNEKIYLK
jgi:hypothetical protein